MKKHLNKIIDDRVPIGTALLLGGGVAIILAVALSIFGLPTSTVIQMAIMLWVVITLLAYLGQKKGS